jgi:predicted RNase H-like nuclease (RuvC/YqgF family)
MKKFILNWLLKDSDLLVFINALRSSVKTVEELESLHRLIRDVKTATAETYELSGKLDDLKDVAETTEYEFDSFKNDYDLSTMQSNIDDCASAIERLDADVIDDHTQAIETLECRLDEIVSPEGFEVRLTAKLDQKVSK